MGDTGHLDFPGIGSPCPQNKRLGGSHHRSARFEQQQIGSALRDWKTGLPARNRVTMPTGISWLSFNVRVLHINVESTADE
jgi:hypothetical protein